MSALFFLDAPATTEIYTLSLHDALPICRGVARGRTRDSLPSRDRLSTASVPNAPPLPSGSSQSGVRSEEHTSELQSLTNLVCRLLLEKKKLHTPLWKRTY